MVWVGYRALKGIHNGIQKRRKPQRALSIKSGGGDEKIRTSDPGFSQMLP